MDKYIYNGQAIDIGKVLELLCEMTTQADEDTPSENRSRHFRDTMDECYEFLAEKGILTLN
jgi:hypothetical protein